MPTATRHTRINKYVVCLCQQDFFSTNGKPINNLCYKRNVRLFTMTDRFLSVDGANILSNVIR